jgi:hypothetical protein
LFSILNEYSQKNYVFHIFDFQNKLSDSSSSSFSSSISFCNLTHSATLFLDFGDFIRKFLHWMIDVFPNNQIISLTMNTQNRLFHPDIYQLIISAFPKLQYFEHCLHYLFENFRKYQRKYETIPNVSILANVDVVETQILFEKGSMNNAPTFEATSNF